MRYFCAGSVKSGAQSAKFGVGSVKCEEQSAVNLESSDSTSKPLLAHAVPGVVCSPAALGWGPRDLAPLGEIGGCP